MLHHLQPQLTELTQATQGSYGIAIHHFESGESFEHQADAPFFAASIIKVPIMSAFFEAVHKGYTSYDEPYVLRQEDQVLGSGILQSLTPGLELTLYDIVTLMVIDSDNTATNIMIDRLGTELINEHMRRYGLEQSALHNKLMVIPAHIENVNSITARDMNRLLLLLAEGKIVSWNASREMVKILKQQRYLDGIARALPEQDGLLGAIPDWEIASKTGWTSTVTHDMGLLYRPGHTFAITLLGREMATRQAALDFYGAIGRLLYEASGK